MDSRSTPPAQDRILVVNDNEWSARSLESVLQPAGFDVRRVFTGEQARREIAEQGPDALILDFQLPDTDGPSLCRELRASGAIDDTTPVVITTAAPSNRSLRAEALKAGAWDFVPLPIDGELFLLKLGTLLAARRASRSAGLIDGASGCYTETGFLLRGGELATAASKAGFQVSCVRVSLPGSGSRLGRAVRSIGRRSDVFAVIGPEEVAVLAPVASKGGAAAMASRIAERIRAYLGETAEKTAEVTIGYATADHADPGLMRGLLHRAERASQEARVSGRFGRPLGWHELPGSAA
ncbi:MAG: response regulator [Gemmatimonadales bacterium]